MLCWIIPVAHPEPDPWHRQPQLWPNFAIVAIMYLPLTQSARSIALSPGGTDLDECTTTTSKQPLVDLANPGPVKVTGLLKRTSLRIYHLHITKTVVDARQFSK